MEPKRISNKIPDLQFPDSVLRLALYHSESTRNDPESTSVVSAEEEDASMAAGPPTIRVCSDEMASGGEGGLLAPVSRIPRLRSPSVSELPRPRSPSISDAVIHRQERRLSYQGAAFDDDAEDHPEWGGSVQHHRGQMQLSPGFFRTTRSRVEEPYVFSMSQAPCGGRMGVWDRRGSAPVERLPQTSEPPLESVSGFQKSSGPESSSLPVRGKGPDPKEVAPQRTARPWEKTLHGSSLQATTSVDRWNQPAPHSRWTTRALSLPAPQCLITVASGKPEAPDAAESLEGAVTSGSQSLSEQTRSLLLCPPELPCRRRSVSTEWCSHLESIAEESASLQKINRRYSIPLLPATDM